MSTPALAGIPRINDPAPDFKAKSTHGVIQLSDFTSKDKWIVLFSHPADFTPVCTTEFVEFAKRFDDFDRRNVQLIGVSIDSVFAHIAWMRNIEQNFGVTVKFPVIADLDQKVARAYGMVHEPAAETATVRAVFFIDPKGIIRALLYYPLNLGRNIDEILRVVEALQTSEENACAMPANWRPGDAVIVPPPQTQGEANDRAKDSQKLEVTDWYFAKKRLEK